MFWHTPFMPPTQYPPFRWFRTTLQYGLRTCSGHASAWGRVLKQCWNCSSCLKGIIDLCELPPCAWRSTDVSLTDESLSVACEVVIRPHLSSVALNSMDSRNQRWWQGAQATRTHRLMIHELLLFKFQSFTLLVALTSKVLGQHRERINTYYTGRLPLYLIKI